MRRGWLVAAALLAAVPALAEEGARPRLCLVRVVDNTNRGSEAGLHATLEAELAQHPEIELITGAAYARVAKDRGIPARRLADADVLTQLAGPLRLEVLLIGRLTRRGSGYRLYLSALAPKDARVIADAHVDLTKPRLGASAAAALVRALRAELPLAPPAPGEVPAPEPAPVVNDAEWQSSDLSFDAPSPEAAQAATSVELGGRVGIEAVSYPESLGPDAPRGRHALDVALRARVDTERGRAYASVLLRRDFDEPERDRLDAEEAYVDLPLGPFTLRAGQLITSLGAATLYNPTDVLNPRDLRDPLDPEKLGTWAARVSLPLGTSVLEGYYLPVPAGHLLPSIDGIDPDGSLVSRSRWIGHVPDLGIAPPAGLPLRIELGDGGRPSPAPQHGQGAGRLAMSLPGADVSLGYAYLYDRFPTYRLSVVPVFPTDGTPPYADVTVQPRLQRQHVLTADLESTFGKLRLAAESAAFITKDRGGEDPAVEDPYLVSTLGGDYQTSQFAVDHSLHFFLEVTYAASRAHDGWERAESSLRHPYPLAVLGRVAYELGSDVRLELNAVSSLLGYDVLVVPRLEYVVLDKLKAELTGAWLAGDDADGFFAPFADNSRLGASVTATF